MFINIPHIYSASPVNTIQYTVGIQTVSEGDPTHLRYTFCTWYSIFYKCVYCAFAIIRAVNSNNSNSVPVSAVTMINLAISAQDFVCSSMCLCAVSICVQYVLNIYFYLLSLLIFPFLGI